MNIFKKYKKILIFLFFYSLAIIVAISLHHYYKNGSFDIASLVRDFDIIGSLILGALYSQGATAPIAASIFNLYPGTLSHIFVAFLGGIGAACIDLLMYELIKHELHDELQKMKSSNFFKRLSKYSLLRNRKFLTFLGFAIIASPISDDLGTLLVEEAGIMKIKYFFFINLILNTIGIYIFLSI